MADLTIEREVAETAEARLHNTQIKENYKKLFEDSSFGHTRDADTAVRERPAPVRRLFDEPVSRPAPEDSVRFEGVVYGRQAEAVVEPAPMALGTAPAEIPVPVQEEEGEDARPTPRTMATLNRAAELAAPVLVSEPEAVVGTKAETRAVGFFAALSAKMKAALVAVAVAVVAAVVIIGVNTAVIASMDSQIASKQYRLNEVTEQARKLEQQIEKATDPDTVGAWAQQHGMSYGG